MNPTLIPTLVFTLGVVVGFLVSRYGVRPIWHHSINVLTTAPHQCIDDDIARHARDEFEGE